MTSRSIIWFRRDLRINDNPALLAALAESDEIIPVFILDPTLIKSAGMSQVGMRAWSHFTPKIIQ